VRRLHAVDAKTAALGLFIGQKAADASALVPDLRLADADPARDDAALEALVDACSRFSPAVAKDAPDGLFLDTEGVSHLWGGEADLIDDVIRTLAAHSILARAAIADAAGAAWALARFGDGREIVLSGAEREALAGLPIPALRLEEEAAAQLMRLGIARVGQLAALPRAAITRRFGKGVVLRLDQAMGQAPEALAYRRPPTPWVRRLALAEPISTPEDIARLTTDLCVEICAALAASGRAARRFEFAFHRLDGHVHRIEIGVSRPGREAAPLMRLIARKLEEVDPGFGIEIATVCARQVEARAAAQIGLAHGEAELAKAAVTGLIDSLSNRLGEDAVWRPAPYESHTPERAARHGATLDPVAGGWNAETPRPLRLFRRPEPVEAMAAIPDDPPVMFRWRGRVHRVRRAEGPERIGDEWWAKPIETVSTDQIRDYYRVEDDTGGRYWLYRSGVHGAAEEPKWWLHGVFG